MAAEFVKMHTGTATITNGNSSGTAAISPALPNVARGVLHFSTRDTGSTDRGRPEGCWIRGRITSASLITFDRQDTGGLRDIEWTVTEFNSDVVVEHIAGSTTVSPVDIDCNDVSDTDEAFVLMSHDGSGGNELGIDFWRAHYTDATSINIECDNTTFLSSNPVGYALQSVKFPGANVDTATMSLTGTSLLASGLTVRDLSRTYVFITWSFDSSSSQSADDASVRVRLTADDEVTVDRAAGGLTMLVRYHRVELPAAMIVQIEEVAAAQTSSELTVQHALTPDLTTAADACVVLGAGAGRSWGKINNSGASFTPSTTTVKIVDATEIETQRAENASLALDSTVYAIEFKVPVVGGGRIMSSLVAHGGLVGAGGIAGASGGLAG